MSLAFPLLLLAESGSASSLADFTTCIGPKGQDSVCTLDAATYQISSTLTIGRSNLTVQGATANPADTVLQRAPGFTGTLFQDNFNLTSVTIRSLTLDGNRQRQTAAYSVFGFDFVTGSKSILLSNMRFINSSNLGLGIYRHASGVVINNSTFMNSVNDTIWVAGAVETQVPKGYLKCPTTVFPDSIVLANSTIQGAGENGIYLDGTNVQIVNNHFQRNQSNTGPVYNDPGGQVDLSVCSDSVAVVANTVVDGPLGPNGKWADGIEVHAKNVSLVDNRVQNNAGNGIILFGSEHIFVANWNPATAVSVNGTFAADNFADIAIYNLVGWRSTDDVTIDHANVLNGPAYAIQFVNQTGVPFNHIAITNDCLSGNAGVVQLDNMGPDILIANNATSGCGPN